jgi:predicted transcriptional regulator
MARIKDAERIDRLLDSEGGSLGRREIIEALGLSVDRYEEVANELVKAGVAAKNRGRAGGLSLTTEGVSPDSVVPEPSKPGLERDLYPAFSEYLLSTAKKGDESRCVVLETHRTRARKWETPDLAEIRVTPFPMIGQWEFRVAVYELKRLESWTVDSVLQAAIYNEFAHESWLVIPAGDDADWSERFGPRLVDKAGDLGVGLGSFDEKKKTLQKHMTPRRHAPSLARQQEWLEMVLDKLGTATTREEIANHVRWARSKS